MKQDQEKYFDERIRRKLEEEEYLPAPPLDLSIQQSAGSGFNWLRGFLFGDVILLLLTSMLTFNIISLDHVMGHAIKRVPTAMDKAEFKMGDAVVIHTGSDNFSEESTANFFDQNSEAAQLENERNADGGSKKKDLNSADAISSYADSRYRSNKSEANDLFSKGGAVPQKRLTDNHSQSYSVEENPVNIHTTLSEYTEVSDLQYLTPKGFEMDSHPDYQIGTRDYSHTPEEFLKPFSLELVATAEKTMAYNLIYPELSQLNLNLKPRNNGFGAGLRFNYRIVNKLGIKTGIETILRKYDLSYNYTKSSYVLQPDGTYLEVVEVLTNSRSVSETEVRLPFLATYTFNMNKWMIEPEAGFNLKFKNLDVSSNGNDQIPAALLSSVAVSNDHLVTAGWMFSLLAGYQISERAILILAPYYQAESLGKNTRQYYSGRAVSGAGVNAGIRILFNHHE